MYKNIVFDLGGVVVHFNPKKFLLNRFYNQELEETIYDITFGSDEWKLLDAGEMTREEADEIMMKKAREAGCAFEVQSVLDDWVRTLKPRRKTIDIIRRLKKMGFSIYYLSNIAEDTLNSLYIHDFWPLFDGGVASYEVRANKPNPIMYETLLERYNLVATETIFTDDNPVNAHAAYELGITGIPFQSAADFICELNKCGISIKSR